MSVVRNIATGYGEWSFRLVIEGYPYEFVTDADMETTTADGRMRVNGLIGDEIIIDEQVDLARAKLEVGGQTIKIVDVDGQATAALSTRPVFYQYLTAALTTSGTTVTLSDTTGLTAGDVIHIGTEAILVGTVASSTSLTGCTRAYWQTFPQAHYVVGTSFARYPAVTDVPLTIDGRRARIYFYGQGDPRTGDGELRWIGRVSSGARISEDMTEWTFSLDSVASVLDQDMSTDQKEPMAARGIYYPWDSPLVLTISELSGTNYTSDVATSVDIVLPDATEGGFFETQAEFADALNGLVVAATTGAGMNNTYGVEAVDDYTWRVTVRTAAAANHKYAHINAWSYVDEPVMVGSGLASASGAAIFTIAADSPYYAPMIGNVPRGIFGPSNVSPLVRSSIQPALAETWPNDRVYLSGIPDVTAGTAAHVMWGGDVGERMQRVRSSDASARWVSMQPVPGTSTLLHIPYPNAPPTVKLARYYTTGDVHDFLEAVTNAASDGMNLGTAPDLRQSTVADEDLDDMNLAVIEAIVAEAATDPLQQSRDYTAYSSHKLSEILAAEAQLIGCFWRLDVYGRIVLSKIEPSTDGSNSVADIDESNLATSQGFGALEQEQLGTLNTVVFQTGYAPDEDEYLGAPFTVIDLGSLSLNKAARAVTVEPVSVASAFPEALRPDLLASTYTRIAASLIGLYGGPYEIATVPVITTLMDTALCGTVVTLTHDQMPNGSGTRGITDKPALVIGRKWTPREGYGWLTLLMSSVKFGSYAPAMRVTSVSGATTSWVLTVSSQTITNNELYLPDGVSADEVFAIGDAILLREWDATSPTERSGTVDAVTATTISVTLGSSWAGLGGATYNVGYGLSTSAVTTQRRFAFMADSVTLVDFNGYVPAYLFAG